MRTRRLVLASALALVGLTPASGVAAPAAADDGAAIEAVAITSAGVDHAALVDAVALRLPELRLRGAGELCGRGCVDVRVRAGDPSTGSITVEARLDDGRAFVRDLPAGGSERERRIASSLAHLIASIVDGSAAPVAGDGLDASDADASDAGASDAGASDAGASDAGASDASDAGASDAGDAGASDAGASDASDTREPASPPCPSPATAAACPTAASPPTYELGPAFGLVTAVGLGPPQALAGRVGGGVLLDLELRTPRGLLVSASGRVLDARESGYRLTRLRFAAAVGYGLRRGLFELRALAAVSVEPWWVQARADGARQGSGPALLGGALILAPGIQAALASGVRVHAGVRVSAAASAPIAGAGAIQATDSAGVALFRLGGFEVSVGAEIGARWGMPAQSKRARRRPGAAKGRRAPRGDAKAK